MIYERQGDSISPNTLIDICQAAERFAESKEPDKFFTIDSMYTDSNPNIIHLELSFQQDPRFLQAGDYRQLFIYINGYSDEILDAEAFREAMKTLPMTVYCTTTDLFSEEELDKIYDDGDENLIELDFPTWVVRSFFNDISIDEANTFEEFLDNYIAEDTMGLYDYAKAKGFLAKRSA